MAIAVEQLDLQGVVGTVNTGQGVLGMAQELARQRQVEPQRRAGSQEGKPGVGIAIGRERPVQRRADIVDMPCRRRQIAAQHPTLPRRRRSRDPGDQVTGHRQPGRPQCTLALVQPGQTVIACGIEQPIAHPAGASLRDDQRFAHQIGQHRQHPWRPLQQPPRACGIEPAAKQRQPIEHVAPLVREQVVAPVQRRAQGAVARQGRAPALGQQRKAVIERGGDRRQIERIAARRRQLDRQRQAIELAADRRNQRERGDIARDRHADRPRPLDEQVDRRDIEGLERIALGQGQGREAMNPFAGGAQRLAAGDEDMQVVDPFEQRLDRVGDGIDHMLAVIE